MDVVIEIGIKFEELIICKGWVKLMRKVGVKGIYIVEWDM